MSLSFDIFNPDFSFIHFYNDNLYLVVEEVPLSPYYLVSKGEGQIQSNCDK